MFFRKFFVGPLIVVGLCTNLSALSVNYSMNEKELYFMQASNKAKPTEYGKNRIIAVLDTGIDNNNIELRGQIIAEFDATTGKNISVDTNGHGTKMASVIAAKKDGIGITGVAYNAKLIDVKVVDDSGNIYTESIIRGIEFAAKHNANVISMSFVSGGYSKKLQNIINKYARKGIIFVAAAGNDGEETISYPAGYENVISVGSLNAKTGKRAVYSNYGSWVNEWIGDGIWTYDGKKYSREYGTSEACAVVSAFIEKNTYQTTTQVKHNKRDDDKYKLAFVPPEGIDIDALLESDNGFTYLNSLSQYILVQKKVAYLSKKINKIDLFKLDKKYSHSLSGNVVKLFKDNALPEDVLGKLFIFDLFGSYADLMVSDYSKSENLLDKKTIGKIIETLKSFNDGPVKKIKDINDFTKRMVFLAKGKTGPVAKMVRKVMEEYAGTIGDKSITRFKAGNLGINLEQANKMLGMLKLLEMSLGIIKDYDSTNKKIAYLQVYALDYLMHLRFMFDLDSFENETDLTKAVKNVVYSATKSKENLKIFTKYMKYVGYFSFGLEVVGDLSYYVASEGIDKVSNSESNKAQVQIVSYLLATFLGKDLEEAATVYKYAMYRDFLTSIKNDAVHLEKAANYGYIETKHISTNILANMALKEFTYYGFKELKALFKGNNWGGENKTQLITALKDVKITRAGAKYEYHEINPVGYIASHITNSLLMLPSAVYDDAYNHISNIGNVFEEANKTTDKKLLTDYDYYTDTYDNVQSEYETAIKIFKTDYDELIKTFTDYEKILLEMYSTNKVYDLIAEENTEADKKKAYVDGIISQVKEASKNQVPKISQDFQNIVRDNLIFGDEVGLTLLDQRLFSKMNDNISRKDFMVMMLKASIVEYNPFSDAEFIQKLAEGKLEKTFPDINVKGVSTSDKIWILYGAYKGLIRGDSKGNLNPLVPITRKEAFSLYGGLIKDSKIIYDKLIYQDYQNSEADLVSRYNYEDVSKNTAYFTHIADYNQTSLENFQNMCPEIHSSQTMQWIIDYPNNKIQADNIRTAYLNGIFKGNLAYIKKTTFVPNNYTVYDLYYALNLGENITVFESSVIAKNLYRKMYSSDKSLIPEKKGDTTDSNSYSTCLTGGDVTGVQGLTEAYSGIEKKIVFKTKIPAEDEGLYKITWSSYMGKIKSFSKTITDDGFVETSIVFTPPDVLQTSIVPLTVSISNYSGDSASKDIFLQIKPSSEYGDSTIDQYKPSSIISALYIDTDNKFRVSWSAKNTETLEILYSFDRNNWSRYALLSLDNYQENSIVEDVNDANSHNTIYFKAVSSRDGISSTSSIIALNYQIKQPNSGDKNTEIPSQVLMRSIKDITRDTSVNISWRMVKDSYGNDNAVSYELAYADNPYFENGTVVNLGHVTSHTVSSLKEDKSYYFKVRAINYKGEGEWSSCESTTIDLENLPVFNNSSVVPGDGESGVSKTPTFRWSADDKDGDELQYYIRFGTDKTNLNYGSGWIEGEQLFHFSDVYDKSLNPNTVYYWQVTYREGKRTPEYYGGSYPVSSIFSFTTANEGADLSIENIQLSGDIKPDTRVSFDITIKNNGSEIAERATVRPYYIKNNKEFPFRYSKNITMENILNSGDFEIVHMSLDFLSDLVVYNGVTYDNILTEGNSMIKFKLENISNDTNIQNNVKIYNINYSKSDNLPAITTNKISKNNASDYFETFQYNLGWHLNHRIFAEDNMEITKITTEYRKNINDSWHIAQIFNNDKTDNRDFMYIQNTNWQIPIANEMITDSMQIRVKAYNSDTTYTSKTSKEFVVFSNENIVLEDFIIDKDSVERNETLNFSWKSNGTKDTLYVVYTRQKGSTEWVKLFSMKGGTEKSIEFDYPTGTYEFQLVSSYPARILSDKDIEVETKAGVVAEPVLKNIKTEYIDGKLVVKMECVGNFDRCDIYRKSYDAFEKIGYINSPNKYFIDNYVLYGNQYEYRAVAVKNMVESQASTSKTINAVIDEEYDVVIKTSNYQQLSSNYIILDYEPSKDVSIENYEILLGKSPLNLYTIATTNKRSYKLDYLDYGQTYYIEIYPLDYKGNRVSTHSAKLTFSTGFDKRIISEKPIITIEEVAIDHIILSWSMVSNADEYEVCRSEDGSQYECLETVNDIEYTDRINLLKGSRYKYIVKAKNGNSFILSDESIEVYPNPVDTNDLDGDGIPDIYDPDIDGDGIVNMQDAFPRDPSEWIDTDGDGIGNNADTDDDNDGYEDNEDAFPLDKNEWIDTDGDGIGNNADTDDDNDGISDADERRWGFDPLDAIDGGNADADGDGVSNADEIEAGSDPLDPNDTKRPERYVPVIMDDMVIMVPRR